LEDREVNFTDKKRTGGTGFTYNWWLSDWRIRRERKRHARRDIRAGTGVDRIFEQFVLLRPAAALVVLNRGVCQCYSRGNECGAVGARTALLERWADKTREAAVAVAGEFGRSQYRLY
jgi:hypothetical protein